MIQVIVTVRDDGTVNVQDNISQSVQIEDFGKLFMAFNSKMLSMSAAFAVEASKMGIDVQTFYQKALSGWLSMYLKPVEKPEEIKVEEQQPEAK